MYKIEKYKKKIIACLKDLERNVLFQNAAGFFDVNRTAEEFYRELLNLCYEWSLEHLNTTKDPNYEGADLGDINRKIAVQVTSENDAEKVHKSIEGFKNKSLKDGYNTLYILMFKGKSDFPRANFATTVGGAFKFDRNKHIIDHSDLCAQLKDSKFQKLKNIHNYLRSTVGHIYSELDTSAMPIFPSVSKKDWWVEPNEFNRIKDDLIKETSTTILLPIVIHGMPGIGKSILADELACDESVKNRFTYATLLIRLGQNTYQEQLLNKLNDCIKELGYSKRFDGIESAKNYLHKLLRNRKVLLIVDDVWSNKQLNAFPDSIPGGRLLFTTRNADIFKNNFPMLEPYKLKPLSQEQSLLLLNKLGCDLQEKQRQLALELVEEVGRLPLAIKLLASHIKDGIPLEHLLEQLQEESNKLQILNYGDTNLIALFNLSLRKLNEKQKEHFSWLGILAEDTLITNKIAANVWKIKETEASIILQLLENRALLMINNQDKNNKIYIMHDIAHSRAKHLIYAPKDLHQSTDLPGLGLTIEQAHIELLERYQKKCSKKNLWYTLPDDGYIYARLIWHMQKANNYQEIHNLLVQETPEGKNGWYEAHNNVGRIMDYLQDVEQASQLASLEKNISLEIRYALITTSHHSLSRSMTGELLSCQIKEKLRSKDDTLRYLNFILYDDVRAKTIASLAGLIATEKLLAAVFNISSVYWQLEAIANLAYCLSLEQWKELTDKVEILKTGYEELLTKWMTKVVDYLPKEIVLNLLPKVQNFPDKLKLYQEEALSVLASRLASLGDLTQALSIANSIESTPNKRLAKLLIIKKTQPNEHIKVLQETLEEIYANFDQDDKDIAYVLANLASSFSCLPEQEKEKALTNAYNAVMKLDYGAFKLEQIMLLISYVSPTLREHLLEEAEKMLDTQLTKIHPESDEYHLIVQELAKFYAKQNDINKIIEIIEKIEAIKKPFVLTELLPHLNNSAQIDFVINKIKELLQIEPSLHISVIPKIVLYLSQEEKIQLLKKAEQQLKILDIEEQIKLLMFLSLSLSMNGDFSKIEHVRELLQKANRPYALLWQMWARAFAILSKGSSSETDMLNLSIETLKLIPKNTNNYVKDVLLQIIRYLHPEQLDPVVDLFIQDLEKYEIDDSVGEKLVLRWLELNCIDKAWAMIKRVGSNNKLDSYKWYYLKVLVERIQTFPPEIILEEITTEIEKTNSTDNSIQEVIVNLVPFLAKTQLDKALAMQTRLKALPHQLETSINIAKHLTKNDKASLLMKTLKKTQLFPVHNFIDSQTKVLLLLKVVTLLPKRLRARVIENICSELLTMKFPGFSPKLIESQHIHFLENLPRFTTTLTKTEQDNIYNILLNKYLADSKTIVVLGDKLIFSKLLEYAPNTYLINLTNTNFLKQVTQDENCQGALFAKALIEIARRGSTEQALRMVPNIPNRFNWNGTALAGMSSYLSPSLQEEAISIIETRLDAPAKVEALTYLTYNLKNINLLERILSLTMQLDYAPYRAKILEQVFKPIEKMSPEDSYPIWRKTLEKSIKRPRNEVLSDLTALHLSIAKLGHKETLQKAFIATIDVSRWWE